MSIIGDDEISLDMPDSVADMGIIIIMLFITINVVGVFDLFV